ncbi:hypothetical protein V5O39_24005 [Pseudomonas parakoreensis]
MEQLVFPPLPPAEQPSALLVVESAGFTSEVLEEQQLVVRSRSVSSSPDVAEVAQQLPDATGSKTSTPAGFLVLARHRNSFS